MTPSFKGASAVFMRRELRRRELEAKFLADLPEEHRAAFDRVTATEWVPVDVMDSWIRAAAPLLYAGKVGAVRLLGRDIALDHLPGIYRIFIRLASVPFILEQAAKIFRTYHSKGSAHIERDGDLRSVRLVISHYPDMPQSLRDSGAGFIIGTLETVGAKDVRVAIHGDDDPWSFDVTWR